MKSFWVKFGRVEARSMAEARRVEVVFFFIAYCFCLSFLSLVWCFYNFALFLQELQKEAACGTVGAQSS